MFVGERLAELRKDKGKTQKQLAEELHVNYRTYSSYEREETEPGDDVKNCHCQIFQREFRLPTRRHQPAASA